MIILTFVDNLGGMMFNHRRQSQDRAALQKIISMTAGSVLWVNAYTAQLFAGYDAPQVQEDEHFLDKAGPGEFCLVEGADILPFSFFIEEIILFNWNRAYPADRHFPIDIHNGKWRCTAREDFTGSSHKRITMEVYKFETVMSEWALKRAQKSNRRNCGKNQYGAGVSLARRAARL